MSFWLPLFPVAYLQTWGLILLGPGSIVYLISVYFNLIWLILWPRILSILVNDPCALGKNVCYPAITLSVLQIQIAQMCWWYFLGLLYPNFVFDLLITETEIWNSLTITVDLTIFPFITNRFCITDFETMFLDVSYDYYGFLVIWPFHHYNIHLLMFIDLKSIHSGVSIANSFSCDRYWPDMSFTLLPLTYLYLN